jgi:hypothetical protein
LTGDDHQRVGVTPCFTRTKKLIGRLAGYQAVIHQSVDDLLEAEAVVGVR